MKKYPNIDIIRYLNDRNIQIWTRGKNVKSGDINIQCFNCGDLSNHLRIRPTAYIECWKCDFEGPFYKLIQHFDNCSRQEALKIQKEYESDSPLIIPQQEERIVRDINSFKFPYGFKRTLHKPHKEYLISRNFDPDELQFKYGLRSCLGENQDWKYRIIIPVFINNKIVNFVGRTILDNEEIRYKDSKDEWVIPKRECVYNIDSIKEDGVIVCVEGPADVWAGGDGFVGMLSTNFTIEQIELIKNKNPKKVFICFDNPEFDPNAIKKAEELESYLYFTDVEFIDLPSGVKDFGELDKKEIKYLRSLIF